MRTSYAFDESGLIWDIEASEYRILKPSRVLPSPDVTRCRVKRIAP